MQMLKRLMPSIGKRGVMILSVQNYEACVWNKFVKAFADLWRCFGIICAVD